MENTMTPIHCSCKFPVLKFPTNQRLRSENFDEIEYCVVSFRENERKYIQKNWIDTCLHHLLIPCPPWPTKYWTSPLRWRTSTLESSWPHPTINSSVTCSFIKYVVCTQHNSILLLLLLIDRWYFSRSRSVFVLTGGAVNQFTKTFVR